MKLVDRIYDKYEVTEPVLLALIASPSMQRLKGISQYGLPAEYYIPHLPWLSRYEHSIGVMLLLRRLGAPLEEQVAGLLHDVSHTAFSHIVDWAIGDHLKEDYQDKRHRQVIEDSELADILKEYNLSVGAIADYDRYPLLEQPTPRLCADRYDYAIRELFDWAAPEIVPDCLEMVMVQDGLMAFSRFDVAAAFARGYLKCQEEHWGSVESRLRYYLFAKVLRRALQLEIITEADFSADDQIVLAKLLASKDGEINSLLSILREPLAETTVEEYLAQSPRKKFRYIDPYVLGESGQLVPLTALDGEYAALLQAAKERCLSGIR